MQEVPGYPFKGVPQASDPLSKLTRTTEPQLQTLLLNFTPIRAQFP